MNMSELNELMAWSLATLMVLGGMLASYLAATFPMGPRRRADRRRK